MRVQSVLRVLPVAGLIVFLAALADAKTIDIGFRSGLAHCYGGATGSYGEGWYRPSDLPLECVRYQEQGFEFVIGVMSSGFDFDFGGLSIFGVDNGHVMLSRIDGQPFSLVYGAFYMFRYAASGPPPGPEVRSDRGGYLLVEEVGAALFPGPQWREVELVSFRGEPGFGWGDVIVLKSLTVRVPEPAALLLLGLGAVGLAFHRRCR